MTEREKELIVGALARVQVIHTNLNDFRKEFNNSMNEMDSQFNQINQRLDKIIVKKEEQNEEIRQSLKKILKNLES